MNTTTVNPTGRLIVDVEDTTVINQVRNAIKMLKGVTKVSIERTPKYSEQVSPSGDTWWDDPENVKMVNEGIEDVNAGRVEEMTSQQVREYFGL